MFGHLFAVIIRSVTLLSFILVSVSLSWTDHQQGNFSRNGPWLKWNLQVLDGWLGSAPRTVC